MKPIKFKESNIVFAENQTQYLPLPAYKSCEGEVISCWRLTWRERLKVLLDGEIWIRVLTFGNPLQPLLPEIDSPFLNK